MNHLALLISAYLAITSGLDNGVSDLKVDKSEWEAYKLEHGKHYPDPKVDLMRSMIYAKNKHEIEQFNRDSEESRYYTRGLNHLSDWTKEEINSMMGLKVPSDAESHEQLLQNSPEAELFLRSILQDNSTSDVPDEVDWRKVSGRVSSVKNQGKCGSCWAFSAVGALEGQEAGRINTSSSSSVVDLSPQNLVDCDDKANGCNGGWMASAFEFIKEEGGIDGDKSYPYTAHKGQCNFRKDEVVISDTGFAFLPESDEESLKKAVAKFGPVSIAVAANEWVDYKGGIFQSTTCRGDWIFSLNHGVLVVGYGHDKETKLDYWLIKNSWSTKWGEQGYIRLARNKDNLCGVATAPTIPTF